MTKGGTIILALTPSRRAMGYAASDNLGLIDADYLNLRDCQTEQERCTRIIQWLHFAIRHVQPTRIVVEHIDKRRLTKPVQDLMESLHSVIDEHTHISKKRCKRKDALQTLITKQYQTQQHAIRELAKTISVDCNLLRFHPPPKSKERHDWDRTWGQAVAAAAIALHVKTNNF